MKTNQGNNADRKPASSFLLISTAIGVLLIVGVAVFYYFSTNTTVTP